jgi:diguanylate cyclase (GGDEF)-like protein
MVLRDSLNLPVRKLFRQPSVHELNPSPLTSSPWRKFLRAWRNERLLRLHLSEPTPRQTIHLSTEQQHAVRMLGQQALSGMDLPELFQATVETVSETLQMPYCRLWQVQSDGQTLRSLVQIGWDLETALPNMNADPSLQTLLNSADPIHIRPGDVSAPTASLIPWMPLDSPEGLGVMVQKQSVPLALLETYSNRSRPFQRHESLFLQAVGQVLATAIIRKQTEALLTTRGQILEKVAAGIALPEILHQLCLRLEAQSPGARCAITLVDESGHHLCGTVAPSMSAAYCRTINGLKVAETAVSCGAAVHHKIAIFISDITQAPLCEELQDFAVQPHVRACWSMPFFSSSEKVLGTVSLHHDVPCEPSHYHRQLMTTAAHLARTAVERCRAAEQLQQQALYDSLTGLCNRTFFIEQLRQNLQASQQPVDEAPEAQGCRAFAVLFLDVDRFKVVNDSLGHTLGDQLLVEIARRLERCIRDHDTFSRLGGDEFAILLKELENVAMAQAIADRIKAVLSFPFKIGEREVFTSVSVGIAHSGNGYQTPEEILRDADIAMYRSKAQGRSSATVFDKTMHARVLSRLQIETSLQQAVQDLLLNQEPQFQLHYQPILSLTTGKIAGFEALLRWINPDLGRLSPLDFIPMAEETGLIVPLGRWVLQEACGQLRRWQTLSGCPHLSMSVNVSSRQFLQPEFISDIQHLLRATQVPPTCLKLEITESVLMETVTSVMERLEQLREMGICLSLDDFGTGYSSLSYLQRFPINTLKIDRSFVQQLEVGQEEIVRAIVALAHGLKMDAIAEGIETPEQLANIQALGCEFGQGYLFSPPVNHAEAEKLLTDPPNWVKSPQP